MKIDYVYRFDEDDEKVFFSSGWCVDDEDREEKDGRRMKKMNSINPNVLFEFF